MSALRFAHRWLVAYLVLSMLPFPAPVIPGIEALARWAAGPWRALVTRVGEALGVAAPQRFTGSGDAAYNWVEILCVAAAATLIAAAWSASGRPLSARLLDRARAYARLYVGGTLLVYGWSKVIPTQFPAPGPDRLIVPYGDSSPMGLLWTFMGASAGYTILAGLAEVVAGTLLMWRRTALLGGTLAAAVLANVVALNFCYDVPVKLLSSHLLLLTFFALAPDLPRIAAALGSDRPIAPRVSDPFPVGRGWRRAWTAGKLALLAMIAADALGVGSVYSSGASEVAGVYRVERFVREGVADREVPDALRWLRVGIGASGRGAIQRADGTAERFLARPGGERGALRWSRIGGDEVAVLRYFEAEGGALTLQSRDFFGASVFALLRRDETPPTLTSRPLRLVQEAPFNR